MRNRSILLWSGLLGLAAFWLRFVGLGWGWGAHAHPDEARIVYAVEELLRSGGNPRFFAYGHLPLYLQALVFKFRDLAGLLGDDRFNEIVLSGRIVAACAGIGTIFLTGRIALLLGRPVSEALLAAFLVTFFPLSVALFQFSTVDAHATFFSLWTLERLILFRNERSWRGFLLLAATLGGALACKANSFLLFGVVILFAARKWRDPRSWLLPIAALLFFFLFQPYAGIEWRGFLRDVAEQTRWVRGHHPPVFFHQYEPTLAYLSSARDLFFFSVGPPAFVLSIFGLWASRKVRVSWVLSVWLIANILLLGTSYAKFSRYWLPVIPLLALFSAWGFSDLRSRIPRIAGIALATLLGTYTFLAGIATHTVHLQEHPNLKLHSALDRIAPPGRDLRVLYDSVWVGFPPLQASISGRRVRSDTAGLFELDPPDTLARRVAEKFSSADYFITINSLSIRSALEQSGRKPMHAAVFSALAEDRLGYRLRATVTTEPFFFRSFLRTFRLDPSIPIYDRPTIYLWENVGRRPADAILREMLTADVTPPENALRYFGCLSEGGRSCKTFLDVPVSLTEEKPDGTGETPEGLDSILSPRPAKVAAWYLFFLLTGLALWPLLGQRLSGSLAKGYGLARIFGWVLFGYVVWIVGHLPGGLAEKGGVRVLWCATLLAGLHLWRKRAFLRQVDWKELLRFEALFLGTFLLFLLFRFFASDVYWSENPIDLGYLGGLIKSRSLPPIDPGYSGTTLNYYYYGFFLFSLPAKLFSIPPNVAYVLAQATVPSLIAGLALTLGSSIDTKRPRVVWGAAALLLVLLVGNWDGLAQWVTRASLAHPLAWNFDFFRSAHAVIEKTVHEFPLWSYLFVDLHAHVISGVLFLAFLTWLRFTDLAAISRAEAANGALLLGALGPTSTWDYFTLSVLVLAISLSIAAWRRDPGALRKPLLLLLLSYLLYVPFYLLFTRRISPIGIGLAGDLMTDPGAAWIAMGLFLTFAFLAHAVLWREVARNRRGLKALLLLILPAAIGITLWLAFDRFPWTYLLYSLAATPFLFLFFARKPTFPYLNVNLLIGFAFFILSMCEIFVIKDFLQGGEWKRMNTVFKFYYQTWFLLALASPALIALTTRKIRPTWGRRLFLGISAVAVLVALVWTFAAVPTRTRTGIFQHPLLHGVRREPTLDGLGWLKRLRPYEYRTIAWLVRYGSADDVLLEASLEDYRYDYNVVSAASGVPSVLSWWSHADQRDRSAGERIPLVRGAYETTDPGIALRILRSLGVSYVYVGERERERYGAAGLAKFADRPDLFRPVLSFPESVLYRVNRRPRPPS